MRNSKGGGENALKIDKKISRIELKLFLMNQFVNILQERPRQARNKANS